MTLLRTLDLEIARPKYAHVERERRFLVDRARRPRVEGGAHILIEDRYIEGTRLRLRRMTDSASGAMTVKLTKKYGGDPLAQPIVTAYLDEAEYQLLAGLPARPLVKRRYPVLLPEGELGIDLFEGALGGLETAEIELPDAAALAAFAMPDWLVRDVSTEGRYSGAALAQLQAGEVEALIA